MRNLIYVFVVLFSFQSLFAQSVKEKKLFEGKNIDPYSLYDFKFDEKSGSYLYSQTDTVNYKSKIISNKGNSEIFNNIITYNALFDGKGNYYVSASNTFDNNNTVFFFVKNGVKLKSFENITDPISRNGDNIYFAAREGGQDMLVIYNTNTNDFLFGNKYDTINYVYIKENIYAEGEPMFEIGFTKEGEPYYQACKDGKQFIVIGSREMKKYDEVMYYNVIQDKNGTICYSVRNFVNGKNEYCLVQGEKEYKKFTSVNMPVVFDNSNTPIYSASDLPEDYPMEQFVVKGNDIVSRRFSRGVYDIFITPSGKIAYNGSDTLADGSFVNTLFVDGKEIARYPSIFEIKFRKNDAPVFVASNPANESFVIDGSKQISEKYGYVYNVEIAPDGSVSYTGMNYGNYDAHIPDKYYFVHGKKKYGPFKDIMMTERLDDQIVFNDKGEYAYIGSVTSPGKEYEITKFYVANNDWKSDKFDGITDLHSYNSDFFYTATNYFDDGRSTNQMFMNEDKLGGEYELITNFNLDKDKKIITFNGVKKNAVYRVTVTL
ncbi:MAG: hypothetical protein LWX07_07615 [Bacteroidetes bacterium]|nr:hypothetical protein [Bacteroidota bacterium]